MYTILHMTALLCIAERDVSFSQSSSYPGSLLLILEEFVCLSHWKKLCSV